MNVVWTMVFPDGDGGGNPCPVVFDGEGLSDAEMQAMAAEFGFETAFVLPAREGGDARLRFFVPEREMPMCVHATIAATVLLRTATRLETPLAVRDVVREGRGATVLMPAPTVARVDAPAVCAALGVHGDVDVVSTGSPKAMLSVDDEAALDALSPAYEDLWDACSAIGTTGAYVFTLQARDADVAARQFPLRAGYVEDPATGVAASALAGHLARGEDGWHEFTIAQGRAMGRPSRLHAAALVADGEVTATRISGTIA